tara:strand:+ start:91703 stop:91906 length:204 start_codon:yes stop_codon:yes gene_type:complete
MLNPFSSIILIIIGLIMIALGMIYSEPTPTVKISHSSGECVEVINYTKETRFSCDNLPEKYDHVWVK